MDEILVIASNARQRGFRRWPESRNTLYCTGTADELVIERALNDLNSTRGGVVRLSEGTFNIASTIDLPDLGGDGGRVRLAGSGMLSTIISPASGLTSVIDMEGYKNAISDLSISGRGASDTANSDGINVNDVQCLIERVYIESCKGDGIEITLGASECVITNNIIKGCLRNGIRATSGSDYYITDNVIRQCGTNQGDTKPTDWTGADSTRFFGILGNGSCIIKGNHIWACDTGIGCNGMNLATVTGNIIADNYMGGIEIYHGTNAGTSNTFTGNTLYTTSDNFAGGRAVYIWDTGGHHDNVFLGNVFDDSNTRWAYIFDLATGNRTIVAHNTIKGNRNSATGVNVAAGVTSASIYDNKITLTGTTPTYIADAGTSTVIRDNLGYVNSNAGATSVADGGTITHGLAATPTRVYVTPSVTNEFVSVTALAATTFTVAIKNDTGGAGTTQTVYWRAEV